MSKRKREKKPATPDDEAKKSLENIRDAASVFKNKTSEPPTTCPTLTCKGRHFVKDRIRVRKRFPSTFVYLYCTTCGEPVFRFPPVIRMAPQNEIGPAAQTPRPSPQG